MGVTKAITDALDNALAQVAQLEPRNWAAGVSFYLDTLEGSERVRFAKASPHELGDVRTMLQAIARVRKAMGKLPVVPEEVERAASRHGDDKLVLLANVLTPPGWEATTKPALAALRESIFTLFAAGKPPAVPELETGKKKKAEPRDERSDADLAAEYRVYDNMIRFLDYTAAQGLQARQRIEREGAKMEARRA